MAADGTTPDTGPNHRDLLDFGSPYERDPGAFATAAVDEFADTFELVRFIVSEVGNLRDDDTLRNALERTLFRAQRRAEIVSKVVHGLEWEASRAKDAKAAPGAG